MTEHTTPGLTLPSTFVSPTPIEDIWDNGHPDDWVQYLREKYFWIVAALRNNPSQRYFVFDGTRTAPTFQSRIVNPHNLHYLDFDDWDMYRSSADMLKRGLTLLNNHFYRYMSEPKGPRTYITDQELATLLEIVECWSGVFGCRPVMEPSIPSQMQSAIDAAVVSSTGPTTADLASHMRKTDPALLEKLNIPAVSGASDINHDAACRTYVSQARIRAKEAGLSDYDAGQLLEWHVKPAADTQSLSYLLRLAANMSVDEKGEAAFDANNNKALMDYMAPKMMDEKAIWKIEHPGMDDTTHINNFIERMGWQTTEIQQFASFCFRGGALTLRLHPVSLTLKALTL